MARLHYKKKPVQAIGYFDAGSNGDLSDLKRTNSLNVIRWIEATDWSGSPSLARDCINLIEQATEMLGRSSDIDFVYKSNGKIRILKNDNHLN